ncbi:hypothetical protein COCOBI_11-2070 [Coccomyxa sp. Obi]|nr:hypothetical protein COCOBI_11-2070 [Coccomyxa sp. Obi]
MTNAHSMQVASSPLSQSRLFTRFHNASGDSGLSMTSEEEDTAELPVEIWQQIAGHMSSRCWARVSRTCKAMHSVQPEQIDIDVRSQSALSWVQTHWGQASALKLTWMQSDRPRLIAHDTANLRSLKRLELFLKEVKSPTIAMLLTRRLARAPQLQLLTVRYPTALMVPPIRNLRHLILASNEFSQTCVASIRQLDNLQTLWLGIADVPHASNVCAEFDLASMPQLTDVCVNSVPMPTMTLPKHCRLHLVGDEEDTFVNTLYMNSKEGHLKSIDLRSPGFIAPEPGCDDIPNFLWIPSYPVLKWWDMTQLGKPTSPVEFDPQFFPCLTHLKLMGRDINIFLPHELPLQVLDLEAGSLSVICEKVQEQAKRLQQLRVQYCAVRGADIFALVGTMCGMGAIMNKVGMEEPGWIDPEKHHGFSVSYQHMPDIWKCPCGDCLDCVRQILGC